MKPAAHTVQDVIDLLVGTVSKQPGAETVDTVKTGNASQDLSGVVTTFMANIEVIKGAVATGSNLIVTHEPTFYNHRDETEWLSGDAVYQAKRRLLDDHGIVVFRFHDQMHRIRPDPVVRAFVDQLGWAGNAEPDATNVFRFEPRRLSEVVAELGAKLGAPDPRVVGDPAMTCERIGLMVGASGGRRQILFLAQSSVDVLIVGEIAEWETSEYVRDAISAGRRQALIVAGHSVSESAGMKWLAGWLRERLVGVPVTYIPAEAPFRHLQA